MDSKTSELLVDISELDSKTNESLVDISEFICTYTCNNCTHIAIKISETNNICSKCKSEDIVIKPYVHQMFINKTKPKDKTKPACNN